MSDSWESIANVLENGRDFDVIESIVNLILQIGPKIEDLDNLPEEASIVMRVYHVSGIVEGGGFYSLFASDIPGDPQYLNALSAFEKIGCESASEAIQDAFRMFPDGIPPSDFDLRIRQYLDGFGSRRYPCDKKFFDSSKETENRLALYIRRNLNIWNNIYLLRSKAMSETIDDDSAQSSARSSDHSIDFSRIPRLKWIQFASGCARIVHPLFKRSYPAADRRTRLILSNAIRLSWRAGGGKHLEKSILEDAKDDLIMLSGSLMNQGVYGISYAGSSDIDGVSARISVEVVKSAERALEASLADPEDSGGFALQSHQCALDAASLAQSHKSIERINRWVKKNIFLN